MKAFAPDLGAAYAGRVTTLADCCIVRRRDGLELYLTGHQFNIERQGVIYSAKGGFQQSAHASAAGLSVDNLELVGLLDDARISEADIRRRLWVGAQVWLFRLDYTNPNGGIDKLDYGLIGETVLRRGTFVAEFRSLNDLLNQTTGDKYGTRCRTRLGSTDCGVILDPPVRPADTQVEVGQVYRASVYDARRYLVTAGGLTDMAEPTWDTTIGNTTTEVGGVAYVAAEAWTKQLTVTAASDRQTFADTSRTEPDHWFRFGEIQWLTGANAGLVVDVKSYAAGGAFALPFPMPFDIAAGDTAIAVTGCNQFSKMPGDVWGQPYTGDCVAKFGNGKNFMAEPDITPPDQLLRGPA